MDLILSGGDHHHDHESMVGKSTNKNMINGAEYHGATSSVLLAKKKSINNNYIDHDHDGDYEPDDYDDSFKKFSDFLKSLRALKIRDVVGPDGGGDGGERTMMSSGLDVSESDLPHVEWISELVQ